MDEVIVYEYSFEPAHEGLGWFDMGSKFNLHVPGTPPTSHILSRENILLTATRSENHTTGSNLDSFWTENSLSDHIVSENTNVQLNDVQISMDDFFIPNGARLSPSPCTHCSRYRLQCLILQTTAANPNPVTACSSCVALFRECSNAQGEKRGPARFESSAPVIGQLHGINEEDDFFAQLQEPATQISSGLELSPAVDAVEFPIANNKKQSVSRMRRQTKPLREWFNTHQDDPYPTEDEKELLIDLSGLTKKQVVNWFTNARRRQRQSARALLSKKVFVAGSPMPRSSLSPSPLERWKNSPPGEDHVSPAAIQAALSSSAEWSEFMTNQLGEPRSLSGTSSHTEPFAYDQSSVFWTSSASDSSWQSQLSATNELGSSASQRSFHRSIKSSCHEPQKKQTSAYQCTFCHKIFKKQHDWFRHERSVHMPSLSIYVCESPSLSNSDQALRVWRLHNSEPECSLCGHRSPDDEHFQFHEFGPCSERSLTERSFARRDHLWQHLRKFHHCRQWEGWEWNVGLWRRQRDQIRSRCGFCDSQFSTWTERASHITRHFKAGLTMDQWAGVLDIVEAPDSLDQMPLSTDFEGTAFFENESGAFDNPNTF